MSRKVGAVGTLIWDRVRHPSSARVTEQWGGAIYSLSALAAACPPGWTIEPFLKVGEDMSAPASETLSRIPRLDLDCVRVVPEPTNRVELRYHDPSTRCETLTGGVPSWSWGELEGPLSGLDALYVNFISGFEFGRETARRLRASFRGPIYADLHSLFLGPPGHGPRRPRPLPRWREWLACFDVVQMNEDELALLGPEAEPIEALLDHGPSVVFVTLGARGVRYASRPDLPPDPTRWRGSAAGAAETGWIPTPRALEGDPTGCGDVWGATAFAGLLGGLSLRDAAMAAQEAAATKIAEPSTERLHRALASSTSARVLS